MIANRFLLVSIVLLFAGFSIGMAVATIAISPSRSQDQTKAALDVARKWEDVAKKWENNSKDFERLAKQCAR